MTHMTHWSAFLTLYDFCSDGPARTGRTAVTNCEIGRVGRYDGIAGAAKTQRTKSVSVCAGDTGS